MELLIIKKTCTIRCPAPYPTSIHVHQQILLRFIVVIGGNEDKYTKPCEREGQKKDVFLFFAPISGWSVTGGVFSVCTTLSKPFRESFIPTFCPFFTTNSFKVNQLQFASTIYFTWTQASSLKWIKTTKFPTISQHMHKIVDFIF